MQVFKRGDRVMYRGQQSTVDYVVIRSKGLLIFLTGSAKPCDPRELTLLQAPRQPGMAAPRPRGGTGGLR